jgi:hypothetical protein
MSSSSSSWATSLDTQMTPEEWKIWKRVNARPAKAIAAYPDLERQDFDQTLDQTIHSFEI